MRTLPKSPARALHAAMLAVAALFLLLHVVHLSADFPNHSPWMDWSKYTDEGWYGDAAIRHYQLGHWYVPGDFNPAVALPVWPFLEALVFRFTGVSLYAARALTVAVFGGILVSSWLLLWRARSPRDPAPLAAPTAVLFLAVSPFCFVFTRLAILEPLLVLLMLLALLAGQSAAETVSAPDTLGRNSLLRANSQTVQTLDAIRQNLGAVLSLGLLLPLMVLTKTTALFLLPAVAWMLFSALGFRLLPFLRVGLPAAALALALWLGYFFLLVRRHLLLDYRYLFSANAYTGITRENMFSVFVDTVKDGMWMGSVLFPAALAVTVLALLQFRRLRHHPLIPTLLLWAAGYTAFLAYHNNLQPRYYLVVAVPLTLLLPYALENLLFPRLHTPAAYGFFIAVTGLLLLAIVLPDARQTLHFIRYPQYTLLQAARQVHDYIADDLKRDPKHNPLILSISGSDLSLMTGLPSICDDFGTLELADRVQKYHPGWYAAWNELDDDKMDAMTPLFHIERVAAFPAMDDPDRNLLILYRLDDSVPTPRRLRRRKPTPRRLRTRVGQQPSTTQLVH